MHSIPQRVEDGSVVGGNGGIDLPDIRFRNANVLGEGAIGVNADDLHVLADVRFANAALKALAASHVHLGADKVAFLDGGDLAAHGGDRAAEFMTGNQRRVNALLRPSVPIVDMQIGPADGGDLHLHQHIVGAEAGNFDVADFSAGAAGGLDHGQHGCGHQRGPRSGGRRAGKLLILAREKRLIV